MTGGKSHTTLHYHNTRLATITGGVPAHSPFFGNAGLVYWDFIWKSLGGRVVNGVPQPKPSGPVAHRVSALGLPYRLHSPLYPLGTIQYSLILQFWATTVIWAPRVGRMAWPGRLRPTNLHLSAVFSASKGWGQKTRPPEALNCSKSKTCKARKTNLHKSVYMTR